MAAHRSTDSAWPAGVMLYWGEGFKTENCLGLADSDEDLVRLFINWSRRYLDRQMQFRTKPNLHAGNDEERAIEFWSLALGLGESDFVKRFIEPEGTGHRRNHLHHGVIRSAHGGRRITS